MIIPVSPHEVCIVQDTTPGCVPEQRQWHYAVEESDMGSDSRLIVSERCGAQMTRNIVTEARRPLYSALSADDWALCIIKPDAKERGLEALIDRMIREKMGRSSLILMRDEVTLTRYELDQIWPTPRDETGNELPPSPWWDATVEYMTSAPVDVRFVHGIGASALLLQAKAEMRRELYGQGYQTIESLPMIDRVRSVIHTSDCDRELVGNLLAFWNHDEIRNAIASQKER